MLESFPQKNICSVVWSCRLATASYQDKKKYGHFFMGGVQDYHATKRRQCTFYHWVPMSFGYSFDRPRKDERLSVPWSHDTQWKNMLKVTNQDTTNLKQLFRIHINENSEISQIPSRFKLWTFYIRNVFLAEVGDVLSYGEVSYPI